MHSIIFGSCNNADTTINTRSTTTSVHINKMSDALNKKLEKLGDIKGVKSQTEKLLNKLGICEIDDIHHKTGLTKKDFIEAARVVLNKESVDAPGVKLFGSNVFNLVKAFQRAEEAVDEKKLAQMKAEVSISSSFCSSL